MEHDHEISFRLEGIHLKMYEQLLDICHKHDRNTLARSLIEAVLEDDAADNQDAVQ